MAVNVLKWMCRTMSLDLRGSGKGQVAQSCECDQEFLDKHSNFQLSRTALFHVVLRM